MHNTVTSAIGNNIWQFPSHAPKNNENHNEKDASLSCALLERLMAWTWWSCLFIPQLFSIKQHKHLKHSNALIQTNWVFKNSWVLCSLLRQGKLLIGIPAHSVEAVSPADTALAGRAALYLCLPCPVTGRPIRCSSLQTPPPSLPPSPSSHPLSSWPHSVIFVFLLRHSQVFYKVSPCITHLTMH